MLSASRFFFDAPRRTGAPMLFEVISRAGKRFSTDSTLSDAEAREALSAKADPSDFDRVLIDAERLSPNMRAWLHILASWAQSPREATPSASFPRTRAMLVSARDAGKKFPKIKLLDSSGQPIVLALNRAGKVNVTDGGGYHEGIWFGAIQLDSAWRPGRDAGSVLEVLVALEQDPERVAAQHGVATGSCCFCARKLTTKESRSVGYGPVCADRFGLAWGAIDADLDAKGKEVPQIGSA